MAADNIIPNGYNIEEATVGNSVEGSSANMTQASTSPPSTVETTTTKWTKGNPNDQIFVGRWVLIESKSTTSLINFESMEIDIKRQIDEDTGDVTYLTNTSWRMRFCCCCCFSASNSNITTFPSKDTFILKHLKTDMLSEGIEYGRIEDDNKYITVGKSGANTALYKGEKCYMTNVDARLSLKIEFVFERVETYA